jgi:aminopeptidase N
MDLYFTRHDGEAATIEQFVQCFADASGRDLSQFMLWYAQSGTPEIVATGTYDARAKTYRLELAQTLSPTPGQPTKEPMVIPLVAGLVGPDGRDVPLQRADGAGRAACSPSTGRPPATCHRIEQRPVPRSIAALGAGAVTVNVSEGPRFLANHDSDPFNRWQAVHTLAMRLLVDSTSHPAERAAASGSCSAAALDAVLTAAISSLHSWHR